MNSRVRPWFGFPYPDRYAGREPHFYDRSALPGVELLEENWTVVRDEVRDMFAGDPGAVLTPYFDRDLIPKPGSWRTYSLLVHGLRNHAHLRKLPRTAALLDRVPGLVSASLSWLEPHSDIRAHFGDTDAYVRAHLGLVVPAPAPVCGLEVGGEVRGWTEGALTLFCDAHEHRAWNHSGQPRLVMIVDVMRPETVARGGWWCAQVLSALALYKLRAGIGDTRSAGWIDSFAGPDQTRTRRVAQLAGAVPFALYRMVQPHVSWLPPRG